MKTLKFKGTEVSLSFDSYQNNGSLAVLMNTVAEDELYGVITVNLGSLLQTDRLAFVDENNLPGIGAWLRKNKIASPLGYKERSGSARILLRPWQDNDAGTLFKYASDPDVGPRAGWPPHKSVEESLEIIRTVFNAEGMWAVIWKESGEAIGCVGYLPASASNLKIAEDQAEVGYWIARPYWGKGICTEALQMVIDYCFNEKCFTTLRGDYFPSNPASGRVMEKCGFVYTGKETLCPNLEVGLDRPVRVMKLENTRIKR